jgi:mevalonate pyrophosphate decarboxylase
MASQKLLLSLTVAAISYLAGPQQAAKLARVARSAVAKQQQQQQQQQQMMMQKRMMTSCSHGSSAAAAAAVAAMAAAVRAPAAPCWLI